MRAIQNYRVNDIVIFIYLSICIGVLPCHLPEESVTQDLQIICYTESPQILQCCRVLKEKQEKHVNLLCAKAESTPIICGNFDNIIYSSSNIHLSYCLLNQNLNLSEALPNHLDTKHPGKSRELYPNKHRYEFVVLKPMYLPVSPLFQALQPRICCQASEVC